MRTEAVRSRCSDRMERDLRRRGYRYIAGVDEVGRGALAGPVLAGAVILDLASFPSGLDDSKRLSPKERDRLAGEIERSALALGIGQADAGVIDKINILQATRLAMRIAIDSLPISPQILLLDAIKLDEVSVPQLPIIKGDELSVSIAAASIVAKVARDRLMKSYEVTYPGYGFASHVGYGTRAHLRALRELGPSQIHRLTFRGVRQEGPGKQPELRQGEFALAREGPAVLPVEDDE